MIYCNLYTLQVFQSRGSMNHFPLDSTAQAFPCSYQSQQGLPLQNGMAGNADVTQFSLNQLNSLLRGNPSLQLPPLDGLGDTARQVKIKKKKIQSSESQYLSLTTLNPFVRMFGFCAYWCTSRLSKDVSISPRVPSSSVYSLWLHVLNIQLHFGIRFQHFGKKTYKVLCRWVLVRINRQLSKVSNNLPYKILYGFVNGILWFLTLMFHFNLNAGSMPTAQMKVEL